MMITDDNLSVRSSENLVLLFNFICIAKPYDKGFHVYFVKNTKIISLYTNEHMQWITIIIVN